MVPERWSAALAQEVEAGDQNHLQPHGKTKASTSYMGSCLTKPNQVKPNQTKPNQQQKETSKIRRGLKHSITTSRTIIKDGESVVAHGQRGSTLSAGKGGRREEDRRTEKLCSESSELDCPPSDRASQLTHTTKMKPPF